VVCNWHPGSAGSTAHGSTPEVWFASAYQTSYDRIEGVWTAEVQYRAASEADARVIAERMINAAGDPPPAPIEMPEGWRLGR
jgi:hypothetical protein